MLLVTGLLPHARPAIAAGNPSTDPPAPAPLSGTALNSILKSEEVGGLPGGGSITGAGDYRYTLPLDVPDGRAGMAPRLSLNYSSHGGNGLLGVGWSLEYGGSEIRRCSKTFNLDGCADTLNYKDDDALCLDGARLVEVGGPGKMGNGTEYRTERDSFARIVAHGDQGNGPDWFEVFARDGTIRIYNALTARRVSSEAPGATADTAAVEDGLVKPVWVLASKRDRSGNEITYLYDVESEAAPPFSFEVRIHSIKYTGRRDGAGNLVEAPLREVVFEYSTPAERLDPLFYYAGGVRHRVSRRLQRVLMYAPRPSLKALIGSYAFAYEDEPGLERSFLTAVHRYDASLSRLWERRFEWAHRPEMAFDVFNDVVTGPYGLQKDTGPLLFDADGDGRPEMLHHGALYRTTPGSTAPFDASVPIGSLFGRPADVDGDGKMEILKVIGGQRVFVKVDPVTGTTTPTSFTLANTATEFTDVDGDGRIDAFEVGPAIHDDNGPFDREWFYRRNTGSSFAAPIASLFAVPYMVGRAAAAYDMDGNGRGELHVGFSPMDEPPAEGTTQAVGHWFYYALGTSDGGTLQHRAARPEGPPSNKVLLDANGDGLKDIVFLEGPGSTVRYNTGAGFLPEEPINADICPRLGKHRFIVEDVDSDGREDLLSSEESATPGGLEPLPSSYLRLHRSSGFTEMVLLAAPYNIPAYDPYDPYDVPPPNLQNHSPLIKTADINADGLLDLVVFQRDRTADTSSVRVLLQQWNPGDVIERVWDENAPEPRETVFYSASPSDRAPSSSPAGCAYPLRCLHGGRVMAREHWIHRQDEPSSIRRTAYHFEDARMDLRGRGFLGFGKVRTVDLDSFAETVTTYDNTTVDEGRYPFASQVQDQWSITPILPTSPDPTQGVVLPPARIPITARVTHSHHSHERRILNGGLTHAVFSTGQRTEEWEQHVELGPDGLTLLNDGSATTPRVRERTRQIDDFGNELSSAAWTVGGQRCETSATYDNLTAPWLIGLIRASQVSCNEHGMPLPEPRLSTMEYDGRGLVKKITVEPNHQELTRTTEHTLDAFGQVTKVVVSAPGERPRKTFLAYDDEHLYPRAVWNSKGHYQRQLIDPGLGVPLVSEDANGVQVHYRYDGFGRVREIDPDDGPSSVISYQADPGVPLGVMVIQTDENGGESRIHTDDHGRTVATEHLGFDGSWVYHRVSYNLFAQATEDYRPAVGQAPSIRTVTRYDTLGRRLRVEEPNDAVTVSTHTMFETITTDAEGRKSRVRRDVDDLVKETADLYQGPGFPQGQWLTTSYHYGPFSQVRDITDPLGNVIHAEYDKLGRKRLLDDPDRGTTQWAYNAFDEITSETDALGEVTLLERDDLGRVTSTNHDSNGVTTFTYDGAGAPGEIGRLTAASSPDGVLTAYHYDSLGRNVRTDWAVGQRVYSVGRSYDSLGRLSTIEYPHVSGRAPFIAEQRYNAQGYLEAVIDASNPLPKTLWKVMGRNADGLLSGTWTGNGFAETRGYDPSTGRLNNIEAVKDGAPLFALHYQRDLTGNVLSRTDYAQGASRKETFGYDALDRLERWTVEHNGADGAQRKTEYGYDLLGNLETVTSPSGVEVHTHDGQVLGGVLRLPHALTGRGMGLPSTSYHYDDRGRQVSGGGREIAYKPFDLPSAVHQDGFTTTFSYDAFGTRARKERTGGTGGAGAVVDGVDTIGGLYERRWEAGEPDRHVFLVYGTDGPAVQIVYTEGAPTEDRTLYLHKEALGSVGLVTDSKGAVVERTYFEPFGGKVDAAGLPASPALGEVKLGFTGHRHDSELGLIDMRGRVFDPAQKRFLTPDPHVTFALFGQSYNRFSYVVNNPLRYTDPTGFDSVPGNPPGGGDPQPGAGAVGPDAPLWPVELWAAPADITPEKSDEAGTVARKGLRPEPGAEILADGRSDEERERDLMWNFWKGVAWGAAKHLLQSTPPVQIVKGVQRNLDVARMAVGHVSDGEWRLAGYAILELPYVQARTAASIITAPIEAAIEIPQLIETAIKAADPEVKGAAAVQVVEDMAVVATAVAGAAEMARGGGGKSSTLRPGPFAGESIPARGPERNFTVHERTAINEIGRETGCHTCGAKAPGTPSGNFIPDHQPPNQLSNGQSQRLYPHCLSCSLRQGGEVLAERTRKP